MVSAAPDSQTVPGRPSGIPIYEHRDLSVLGGQEGFGFFKIYLYSESSPVLI